MLDLLRKFGVDIIEAPFLAPDFLASYFPRTDKIIVPDVYLRAAAAGDPIARLILEHELQHSKMKIPKPALLEELRAMLAASRGMPLAKRLKFLKEFGFPYLTDITSYRWAIPGEAIAREQEEVIIPKLLNQLSSMYEIAEQLYPGRWSAIKNVAQHKGLARTIPLLEGYLSRKLPQTGIYALTKQLEESTLSTIGRHVKALKKFLKFI